jgi:hypothetical protein
VNESPSRTLSKTSRRCTILSALLCACILPSFVFAQTPAPSTPAPQLIDITARTGIHFEHLSSPDKKYIVESMSGGVALIDYDRDGWPDIFFTNAPDVDISLSGTKARSALYHNNHDGTFTDVTRQAGLASDTGWATGATFGDYDTDVAYSAGLGKATVPFVGWGDTFFDLDNSGWPSGKKEVLKDLSADHIYSVLEGQGVVSAERIKPTPSKPH